MNNFWQKFKKPIYALAPMAGITDSAFRQICKEFGADVVYSEMASATALVYNPKKTLKMLQFNEIERPYTVQLFGSEPEHFARAVKLVAKKIKPDGIDINFGCPVAKVIKQGAGAALMQNLKLSFEVIKSVTENTELPVSIKLRSKTKDVDCLKFLDYMSNLSIKAVMIHGRTLSQCFSGEVDWQIIKQARDYFGGMILANGGAMSIQDVQELLNKTKADGVGIARGALGRPWIFDNIKNKKQKIKNREEIFKVALKHAKLANKLKREQGIIEMRKHLCWYVHGLPNAREMRQKLVRVKTLTEVKDVLEL